MTDDPAFTDVLQAAAHRSAEALNPEPEATERSRSALSERLDQIDRDTRATIAGRGAGTRRGSPSRSPSGSHGTLRRPAFLALTLGAVASVAAVIIAHRTSRLPESSARTYITRPGQRATVDLADGSRAVLGPDTRLTIASDATARTSISVIGQALFTVQHRPSRTFEVRVGNAVTRVLGTSFLVRHYATDHTTTVTVAEGRVGIDAEHGRGTAILGARTTGVVDDSGRVSVLETVDGYDGVAGRFVFRNTPVRDVLTELSRAYGVTVRLADSTRANQRLTWTVPDSSYSVTTAIGELAALLDAHVVRANDVITLVPGRTESRTNIPQIHVITPARQYGQ